MTRAEDRAREHAVTAVTAAMADVRAIGSAARSCLHRLADRRPPRR